MCATTEMCWPLSVVKSYCVPTPGSVVRRVLMLCLPVCCPAAAGTDFRAAAESTQAAGCFAYALPYSGLGQGSCRT
ncbi:hypothetical protein GCM10010446_02920 [Streptomyces enissocaesilis]|uniref:Secreted protein n=1 Tax=Streptomyces enissocaesilis TaxID=332589 RepID=A0ABN3WN19_9ACTN